VVAYSREDLEAKIRVALGGRVAEEVVYGKITTGAESDIEQSDPDCAPDGRSLGMSESVGPIALLPGEEAGPLLPGTRETSEQTQRLIDHRVHRLIEQAHAEVTQLLSEHREELGRLADKLLEAETLDAADAYAAAGLPMKPRPTGPVGERHGDHIGATRFTPGGRRHPAGAVAVMARTGTRVPASYATTRRAHVGLVTGYLRELRGDWR